MRRPMRVAFISAQGCPFSLNGENNAGGMNTYLKECLRHLGAESIDVDLFTPRHPQCRHRIAHISPNARVIHIQTGWEGGAAGSMHSHLGEFSDALLSHIRRRATRYQAIYSHYWLSGTVGAELAALQSAPHLISFHTLARLKRRHMTGVLEHPLREETEQRLVNAADRIIVWTRHEKQALVELLGSSPGKVDIIPPGVDISTFRPLDSQWARRHLNIQDPAAPTIMYVGRLDAIKGIPILLKAAKEIDIRPRPKIHIIGSSHSGAAAAELRQTAADIGIQDSVRLWGPARHSALPAIYAAADVVAMPSYYESFGMAALEAAACAKPMVASSVGGLKSIVADGRTGYLIPHQCPDPFADKLELLLSNPVQRRIMGNSARIRAEQFGWNAAAERMRSTLTAAAN